ncbi:oligopeptide ABC transporter ATP-binding protein OppF [Bacillus canaveralius]|uniref:Oligopeptide ABC transporter ATP-binding protein OppF n=1 Tax=Bacillus canaveralius TaxID=1403243 RepID=A0A2N5GKQ1_9BACI|nr:oligopeptide/dipeptide ABC transporter ATP-binding protein [Bacillus canaveralius]PLR82086.1 oligopeptide ABC transporter ATP-binding protein OppF [Bacillus canaveralius]PLR98008.1 oligopeptide ABC transporter ATP-binding protein OppF [Bacillus canaveralius]
MQPRDTLIEINNLKKHFRLKKGKVLQAVDNVSLKIFKGETLGIVGESGCGKSTLGRTLIRLYEPTSGEIKYENQKITGKLKKEEERRFQKKVQMIFQDPYSSLNSRMTVAEIISEGMVIHEPGISKREQEEKIFEILDSVGLHKHHANRYPHEFSGGQRQRIGIARALAVNPEFIIADEPIAALDVSIQAQIVNLLKQLQQRKRLTYMFIAHDLSMVRYISDRVAVMYLGMVVELSTSDKLYEEPFHPYTKALLSAIPIPDPKIERSLERIILEGTVPNPVDPPSGCRFRTRCSYAMDICSQVVPELKEIAPSHHVACHLYSEHQQLSG